MVLDRFSLKGKRILVTGGSGLLGEQWVKAVEEAGGNAFNVDMRKPRMRYGKYINADLTDAEELLERLQGIYFDGLVNNAFLNMSPQSQETDDDWNYQNRLLQASKYLTEYMVFKMSDGGSIVNIGSDLSITGPAPSLYKDRTMKPSHYTTFKHAMVGLTKHYAMLLAPKIRVNILCPGAVRTGNDPEFEDRVKELVPMGRLAEKDEYSAALVFLLSDASKYMTGAVLSMDGGRTSW